MYLGWLTQAIPSSRTSNIIRSSHCPTTAAYVGTQIYNYGSSNLVGTNVISSIQTYSEIGETMSGMFFNYDLSSADSTYLIGGDSGGPSFAVVNGQLALLGEHFSTWGTCGNRMPPAAAIPKALAASSSMATPIPATPPGRLASGGR